MLKIDKNNGIYLTRGDNAYIEVSLNKDYTPREGDTLTFTVRKEWNNPTRFIMITQPLEDNVIKILPEHTKTMEVGRYVYDIQLLTSLGEVFTVVSPSLFYVAEEVSYE